MKIYDRRNKSKVRASENSQLQLVEILVNSSNFKIIFENLSFVMIFKTSKLSYFHMK